MGVTLRLLHYVIPISMRHVYVVDDFDNFYEDDKLVTRDANIYQY